MIANNLVVGTRAAYRACIQRNHAYPTTHLIDYYDIFYLELTNNFPKGTPRRFIPLECAESFLLACDAHPTQCPAQTRFADLELMMFIPLYSMLGQCIIWKAVQLSRQSLPP